MSRPDGAMVRRAAGATRRHIWQLLQHVDPVRAVLPRAGPELKLTVVCIYRGRNADIVRGLLARTPSGASVRLWSLDGDVPPDLAGRTIGSGPGHRFELLNRLISCVPSVDRRDALLLVDDDVRFVVGDVGRLVAAAQRSSLDLYQPAHSALSFANWKFVRRRALTFSRYTDFVEQGPLIGLSPRAQGALLPLPEDLGMAWGVEVRWWTAAQRVGLVLGIVDAVAVQHLTPTAQEYDRTAQESKLAAELRNRGLADISVLQRTLSKSRTGHKANSAPSQAMSPWEAHARCLSDDARVSIVVPTRQRREQVRRLLEALREDRAIREMIVVVDGGTDTTFAALTALAENDPRLRPVWQPHAGAGAARQRGLELAHGDVVLFLDDDVLPTPNLASGHLAEHLAHPGRMVVGALPPQRPQRRTTSSVVDDVYAEDYQTCVADYVRDPSTILAHLWAGNLSLAREQALALGVGDPDFDRLFFEDRDFGLRARAAGIEAVFCPNLFALHQHSGTLRSYLNDSVSQGRALRLLRQRYPAEVEEPTAEAIAGRFPAPARLLVSLSQRHPHGVGVAITSLLAFAAYATGIVRLWKLQRPLVVLLRRAGQGRGVGR